MKVSVVIPTYNRAAFLAETLDAILGQTFPPAEIIIVDDGSTDNTDLVLRAYQGRLQTITIPNSGDLVARNVGLGRATGDLVAFCDSDDVWDEKFLAHMVQLWVAEPKAVAGYSDFRLLKDGVLSQYSKFDDAPAGFFQGLRRVNDRLGFFDVPVIDRLLVYQPFFPSCMVVNRAAFLGIGGWDQILERGSDFATTLRCASHPPLGVCLSPLVAIRKHASNLSADTERMNLRDAHVLDHFLTNHPNLGHLRAKVAESANRRRIDALHSAFSRRNFETVLEIDGMINGDRSLPCHVKVAISRLPRPIGKLLASALSK
jgi:glycosyltransferase involved in cell wall biosynthesis